MTLKTAVRALLATIVLAAITGLLYPLAMTGVAQVAFGTKANGSLVDVHGRPAGSAMIGQAWSGPDWFHGRPSADGYDASASAGSNLGPTSATLSEEIHQRIAAVLKREGPYQPGLTAADVPADLVTASASGLDPDISVASALLQAPRIAAVRGIALAQVRQLIDAHTSSKELGFLGELRVNVLELNLALEQMAPRG
ncbi:MAG: potassium-transporting ATPase subunit KdpC [Planctomycetaceae bacterium]